MVRSRRRLERTLRTSSTGAAPALSVGGRFQHERGGRPQPELAELPVGELVTRLAEQILQLVRNELRLAQAELKQKGKRIGFGAGLTGAAGLISLYGLGALVTAVIAALALVLPVWAAALIVGRAADGGAHAGLSGAGPPPW